jgi:hypothetical protein
MCGWCEVCGDGAASVARLRPPVASKLLVYCYEGSPNWNLGRECVG